mgnify:FL=1
MKKRLIFYVFLVLIAVVGLSSAALAGFLIQDDITIEAHTLSGDVSAAEGLTLTVYAQRNSYLTWDTTFPATAAFQAVTDFTYHPNGVSFSQDAYLHFSTASLNGATSTTLENLMEERNRWSDFLIEPIRELARELAPGEEKTEAVTVADYWEIYPLSLYLSIPNVTYYDEGETSFLTNYFHIPVPAELTVDITVSLDEDGECVQATINPTGEESYGFCSAELVTEQGIYLGLYSCEPGETVDFSHIQGGYGIYRIPLPQEDDYALPVEDIENILPLSAEDAEAVSLLESPWDGIIEVFTVEQGTLRLRLLEEETCTVIEDYWLDADKLPEVVQTEDMLVLLFWEEDTQRFLAYAREDGQYRLWLDTELPLEAYYLSSINAAFDGSRLALVYPWGEYASVGTGLLVYDQSGLLYHGQYISSADSNLLQFFSPERPALQWAGH